MSTGPSPTLSDAGALLRVTSAQPSSGGAQAGKDRARCRERLPASAVRAGPGEGQGLGGPRGQ